MSAIENANEAVIVENPEVSLVPVLHDIRGDAVCSSATENVGAVPAARDTPSDRRTRRQCSIKANAETPDEETAGTSSQAVSKKEPTKARVKQSSCSSHDAAAVAEIIARRKTILNYWRFLNSKSAKKRAPIGPWRPGDATRIFESAPPPAVRDEARLRCSVASEISDCGEIEKIDVEVHVPSDSRKKPLDISIPVCSSAPALSPGGCTISLKLKKIGSAWKPIGEPESGETDSGVEGAVDPDPSPPSHRPPKKKKHRHHHHHAVENGSTHEERKLLKKRRKLLKQLKKSLKRQEELERAVEQSKERSMKKADAQEETSQNHQAEFSRPTSPPPPPASPSPVESPKPPPECAEKPVKKVSKPIAVVAGQPQAKRKPLDQPASEPPKKKSPDGTSSTCERANCEEAETNSRSVRDSLLKQLLEFESAKTSSNPSNPTEAGNHKRPKRNAVADSLIKKLLDETSRSSSAVLEKKSQNILSKFLDGDDLLGHALSFGDEQLLSTPDMSEKSKSVAGQTASGGINIADLPPAPAGEVQYLRQVLNCQYYSIPSSLVVPRDQLFHFFAYPILCFCSLLAKQTALYGLVGREPDAILDGRVIVFATKQLPDILEHPKNYLPVILGSSLSSDGPSTPTSTSSSPSRVETAVAAPDSSSKRPDEESSSSSLLKSLLQPAGNETEEKDEGVLDADGSCEEEKGGSKELETQCDTEKAPLLHSANKKPVPCLVKLPKSGHRCDTEDFVSSTTKAPPGDDASEIPPVGRIRVRSVDDVNRIGVEELMRLGMWKNSDASKIHRGPDAGLWLPRTFGAPGTSAPRARNFTPPPPSLSHHENVKNLLNSWVRNHSIRAPLHQSGSNFVDQHNPFPVPVSAANGVGVSVPSPSPTSFYPGSPSPSAPINFASGDHNHHRLSQLLTSPPLFSPPPTPPVVPRSSFVPPPPLSSFFPFSPADLFPFGDNGLFPMLPNNSGGVDQLNLPVAGGCRELAKSGPVSVGGKLEGKASLPKARTDDEHGKVLGWDSLFTTY